MQPELDIDLDSPSRIRIVQLLWIYALSFFGEDLWRNNSVKPEWCRAWGHRPQYHVVSLGKPCSLPKAPPAFPGSAQSCLFPGVSFELLGHREGSPLSPETDLPTHPPTGVHFCSELLLLPRASCGVLREPLVPKKPRTVLRVSLNEDWVLNTSQTGLQYPTLCHKRKVTTFSLCKYLKVMKLYSKSYKDGHKSLVHVDYMWVHQCCKHAHIIRYKCTAPGP